MVLADATGLVLGAVALGFVHGIEPGHGWPVAASYAIDQSNKWLYGFAASFILGIGHLVSSIAMVAVFFFAKSYFSLTQVNEPITIFGGVQIGGPVSLVAGVLLIGLGIREYFHGHSHDHGGGHSHDHDHGDDHEHDHDHGHDSDHGHSHDHDHDVDGKFAHTHVDAAADDHVHDHGDDHDHGDGDHDHDHGGGHSHDHDHGGGHSHDHDHGGGHSHDRGKPGLLGRLKAFVPFVGGHSHSHDHGSLDEATDRGLWGIAAFAFVLGFAHEEEFEIIAICAGSVYCLELMLIYAVTVIFGIVGLTLLLIAGYERSEEKVKQYAEYLPLFSAVVLVLMGLGFVSGLF